MIASESWPCPKISMRSTASLGGPFASSSKLRKRDSRSAPSVEGGRGSRPNGKWKSSGCTVPPFSPGVGEVRPFCCCVAFVLRVERRGEGDGGGWRRGLLLRARFRGLSGGGSSLRTRFRRGEERTGGVAAAADDAAVGLVHSSRGRIFLCLLKYCPQSAVSYC